ncbi:MAG TPA: glycine--tRNA ligase [candidate division Zixibacteria bacterium]|nr:glycine--tRNA ligase [candidate division Zixibacteria bacterium]
MAKKENKTMNELVALCKRRGYIFQSSEIYGGVASTYDYGPLGVELKRNLKELWWREMVQLRSDIEGIDSAIIMHPKVWIASGHVDEFVDPLVECKECHRRFKADDLATVEQCPVCGSKDSFTEPKLFHLLFQTYMGPVQSEENKAYLRPETAQGIYVNFENVRTPARQKLPFGIAQIGKAFRNEITPGNFTFRTREFEQMEMQFFVHPGEADEWFDYWKEERRKWYSSLGFSMENLTFHVHEKLAHYARAAIDIEYDFPFGRSELEGIHNRGNFDLSRHQEFSGKSFEYFDQARDEKYIPYIIETSGGVDRCLLALLVDALVEEPEEGDPNKTRTVLKLHPRLAPTKAGIFPLVNRDGMPEMAKKIESELREKFMVFYDDGGSIGRRYRRQDEAGTPFCITIDGQSLEDGTVTIRERDTMVQVRVAIDAIAGMIDKYTDEWRRDGGLSI